MEERKVSASFEQMVQKWSIEQCDDYLAKVTHSINRCFSGNHMLPVWITAKKYVEQKKQDLKANE